MLVEIGKKRGRGKLGVLRDMGRTCTWAGQMVWSSGGSVMGVKGLVRAR